MKIGSLIRNYATDRIYLIIGTEVINGRKLWQVLGPPFQLQPGSSEIQRVQYISTGKGPLAGFEVIAE